MPTSEAEFDELLLGTSEPDDEKDKDQDGNTGIEMGCRLADFATSSKGLFRTPTALIPNIAPWQAKTSATLARRDLITMPTCQLVSLKKLLDLQSPKRR